MPEDVFSCFQIVLLKRRNQFWFGNFVTWCPFMLCRVTLNIFTIHWQRNLIKTFGKTEGKGFCIWGKAIGTRGEYRKFVWLSTENFGCFDRSMIENFDGMDSVFRRNVIDRLFVAISHSRNDRREQTLRLDTSQHVVFRDLTAHYA